MRVSKVYRTKGKNPKPIKIKEAAITEKWGLVLSLFSELYECLEKAKTKMRIVHAAPIAIDKNIEPPKMMLSLNGAMSDSFIKYPNVPGRPAIEAMAVNRVNI